MKFYKPGYLTPALISGTLISGTVLSSLGHASLLEEITVTAQKREQNLQDVGIAITAFTGAQTRALGWNDAEKIAAQTPGMVATAYNSDSAISLFSIRGLSQTDFTNHQEAPSVVYMDGAYIPNTSSAGAQLFDVDRIEVLKGPQGTLFGRNATGGLVHIVSKKPTEDFEAYFDLELSEYNTTRIEAAISGALTDNVQARLSVLRHESDGFIRNSAGHDLGGADNTNVRLQLQADLTEKLHGHISLSYGLIDDVPGGSYFPALSSFDANGNTVMGGVAADIAGYVDADGDPLSGEYSPNGYNDKEGFQSTITLDYQVNENVTFTSITNFQDNNSASQEDSDSGPLRYAEFFVSDDVKIFGQEFRLNGTTEEMTWVAGLYYLNIDGDYVTTFYFPEYPTFGFLPGDTVGIFPRNDYAMETESWAVFGQAEYSLTNDLTLVFGMRYTEDEKELDSNGRCVDTLPGFDACGLDYFFLSGLTGPQGTPQVNDAGPFTTDRDDSDITGKIQLDWRLNEETLVYAGYSRGMKAGGFIVPSDGGAFVEEIDFDKEVLHSYEIGVKTEFLDGRMRFNASAFYYDYKDYQAFIFAGITSIIRNFDAEIYGGEIEIVAEPLEGLDIMLGLSLMDATTQDVEISPGVFKDQKVLLAPDVSANLLVRKEWKLNDDDAVTVQIDGMYVDEQEFNAVNSVGARNEDYTVWNTSVSYRFSDHWEATVFARNVFDEEYWTFAFDATAFYGHSPRAYAEPRWAGASVKYTW